MLEDPQTAVGELGLVASAQRADVVAVATAGIAEAADRDAAAATAATTGLSTLLLPVVVELLVVELVVPPTVDVVSPDHGV